MPTHLEALLRPIPGDEPCGTDMSFSAEFDVLRELRREDDQSLDQGEWVTERKRADWSGVLALSESLLSERTKDLRVAGWYAEAAVRLRAFAGLADGLNLYAGLVRDTWDRVHPQADGEDQELRIGSIVWLLSMLQQQCRRVPVLRDGASLIALADLELARQRHQAGMEPGDGLPGWDEVQRLLRSTPTTDVADALSDAQRVLEALAALQAAVDAHLGTDAPSFVAAREASADVVSALERLLRDMGGHTPVASPSPSGADANAARAALQTDSSAPLDRARALAQLRQVADFFRRTEPHSPVAYLAERAASWGEMPLHVWLRTVMKDSGTLSQLEELLGVLPVPADGSQ